MAYSFLKHNPVSMGITQLLGRILYGSVLGGLLAIAQPAVAQQSTPATHAVVELFTSQGCASCPPADNLMCDYAQKSGVIVLTMPVTCWDYLGWQDTLANEKFTDRQRIYAKNRGARRIYTPQVIINGELHALGSDTDAMHRMLASVAASPSPTLPLIVQILPYSKGFRIQIIPLTTQDIDKATVLLVPFHRDKTVAIEGGENKGRNLSYVNVAHDLVPLARISTSASYNSPILINIRHTEAMPDKTNGFAILVQKGNASAQGRMLGAAMFISDEAQPSQ